MGERAWQEDVTEVLLDALEDPDVMNEAAFALAELMNDGFRPRPCLPRGRDVRRLLSWRWKGK